MAWTGSRTKAIHLHIHSLTMGHTFFITGAGHMGIGSNCIEDGDCVMLIAGLNVPVVVRPAKEGRFHVMGQAYIEGLMQGERWTSEGLEDFEFE